MVKHTIIRIFITGTANVGKSTIANSLAGEVISEVSSIQETTLTTITRTILINCNKEIRLFDMITVGGISGRGSHLQLSDIKKMRKKYNVNKGEIMRGEKSPLAILLLKNVNKLSNKSGKTIVLFLFDLIQGFKREDDQLLKELLKTFPRTKMLIVANKSEQLPQPDCDRAIAYYNFPASLRVVKCSGNQKDVLKLADEISLLVL